MAFSFLYLAFRALLGAARSGVPIGRFLPIDEDEALRDSDRDGDKDNGFGRRGVSPSTTTPPRDNVGTARPPVVATARAVVAGQRR